MKIPLTMLTVLVTCSTPALAGPPNLRNLRIIDHTAEIARVEARIVKPAALKSNRGSFHTSFRDASLARDYKAPTMNRLGDVHSSTLKVASDPAHAGMRMESKQVVTSEGTKYKTTTILDSSGRVESYSAKQGGGYLTGTSNARFSEGTSTTK